MGKQSKLRSARKLQGSFFGQMLSQSGVGGLRFVPCGIDPDRLHMVDGSGDYGSCPCGRI